MELSLKWKKLSDTVHKYSVLIKPHGEWFGIMEKNKGRSMLWTLLEKLIVTLSENWKSPYHRTNSPSNWSKHDFTGDQDGLAVPDSCLLFLIMKKHLVLILESYSFITIQIPINKPFFPIEDTNENWLVFK